MATVAFVVPGKVETNHRARVTRNGTYHVKEYVTYKKAVAILARAHCPIDWPLDGHYDVTITVYEPDARRRDLDNACKGLLDGSRGVLWDDDRQIDRLEVVRGYVDRADPRVVVEVALVGEVEISNRREARLEELERMIELRYVYERLLDEGHHYAASAILRAIGEDELAPEETLYVYPLGDDE